jgi:hypothetical protein
VSDVALDVGAAAVVHVGGEVEKPAALVHDQLEPRTSEASFSNMSSPPKVSFGPQG